MVLHPPGCGRVGHRRTIIERRPTPHRGGPSFVCGQDRQAGEIGHTAREVCRSLAVMAENTRSPGDDERPRILPPEEPSADVDPPWSHAQADRAVAAGDDGGPGSTKGALLALGGGLVVTLA